MALLTSELGFDPDIQNCHHGRGQERTCGGKKVAAVTEAINSNKAANKRQNFEQVVKKTAQKKDSLGHNVPANHDGAIMIFTHNVVSSVKLNYLWIFWT